MLENLKYKKKIILFLAIVFLLTAIGLVFIYNTSRKNLIADHNKILEKTAQLTANALYYDLKNVEKIVRLFEENKTLTEYLYITNRMDKDKEPLKQLARDIIKPFNFNLLALYDEKGNEVVYVDIDNPEKKYGEKGDIEKLLHLSDKKNISGFEIHNNTLKISAMGTMTYKQSPFPEDIISYIKIGANIDSEYLNTIKQISGNDIFILKGKNIILSTHKGLSSLNISGKEIEIEGNSYSIKAIPLKSMYDGEIGTFIIALSQKDLASALKSLKWTIFVLALGSIIVSGILGILLIRTITSPLNKLVRLTGEVGSGKFPEEKTFKGGDEVSVLGRHFLEMTKKLKDQKKALDSYTTGLEDAVMKRTRELFDSREEWVRTFNSLTDYVLILNKHYEIVRANKVLLEKLSITNQELSGKKCYTIFCAENGPPEECPVHETLTTGKSSIKEIRYKNLEGYFMVTSSPLIAKENEITGSVYVIKDITEYHDIRHKMISTEKLVSMGQMAAGFAHEINNPMASISGCAELLIDQLESDEIKNISQFEYFYEYLNIIYREAFRCKDIIRGMLRFSRKQFETGMIDVNALLGEILSLLDHTIKIQNIRVIEDFRCSTNSLQANEGEIRQTMLALIVNAIDSMQDGGTLTLRTLDSNDGIHIIIKDTGSGIPAKIKERIFEPFFTTKPVGKGTGLGLFIAFNIVKNCNGRIEIESSEKEGSVFTVIIPITEPQKEPGTQKQVDK